MGDLRAAHREEGEDVALERAQLCLHGGIAKESHRPRS
eukprot:SAG11_NODE_9422_length_913_cov_1.240786_1_plen_37_part_10